MGFSFFACVCVCARGQGSLLNRAHARLACAHTPLWFAYRALCLLLDEKGSDTPCFLSSPLSLSLSLSLFLPNTIAHSRNSFFSPLPSAFSTLAFQRQQAGGRIDVGHRRPDLLPLFEAFSL